MKCLNSKTAEKNVETLTAVQDTVIEVLKTTNPPEEILEKFLSKPPLKITSAGDQLMIGVQLVLPVKRKLKAFMMPDDIKDILKNADQEITFSLDIGSKLPDVLLNGRPLIDVIEKGAKASLKLTLVSNIRNAVMEILKNHEDAPEGTV
jgi:hypothetical protein